MWPLRRLWKRVRITASFLAFLLLLVLFSYGVFYLFDKQFVGGLVRQQQNSRRRDAIAAALKQDILPADIFPADSLRGDVKSDAQILDANEPKLNYNVHIFYYGW